MVVSLCRVSCGATASCCSPYGCTSASAPSGGTTFAVGHRVSSFICLYKPTGARRASQPIGARNSQRLSHLASLSSPCGCSSPIGGHRVLSSTSPRPGTRVRPAGRIISGSFSATPCATSKAYINQHRCGGSRVHTRHKANVNRRGVSLLGAKRPRLGWPAVRPLQRSTPPYIAESELCGSGRMHEEDLAHNTQAGRVRCGRSRARKPLQIRRCGRSRARCTHLTRCYQSPTPASPTQPLRARVGG